MSARRKSADLDLIVETVIYLQTEGRRLARAEAQRVGVSPTQLNVLKLLGEIGELSLSELSRRLAAQNSTVTGIVDRMVASGLVSREQSEKDRRVWTIRMTEKGRKIARSVSVAPWELLHGALDALTEHERDELVTLLKKVAAHVATQLGEHKDG
jgi:DNA-binding MarR family transcriptional regulator